MADLGDAVKAELDRIAISMDTTGELQTPRSQIAFILRKLGPQNTARRLGTTLRTIKTWIAGTKPVPESARSIRNLYRRIRTYDQIQRGRGKIKPHMIRFAQISGTLHFSTDEYRTHFGGTLRLDPRDMAPVIAAWKAGKVIAAGRFMEVALQNASVVENVTFPHDDYDLSMFT